MMVCGTSETTMEKDNGGILEVEHENPAAMPVDYGTIA